MKTPTNPIAMNSLERVDLVKKVALDFSRVAEPKTEEFHRAVERRDSITTLRRKCFPVEANADAELVAKEREASLETANIECFNRVASFKGGDYRLLDISFLKHLGVQKLGDRSVNLPVFAVFDLQKPVTGFSCTLKRVPFEEEVMQTVNSIRGKRLQKASRWQVSSLEYGVPLDRQMKLCFGNTFQFVQDYAFEQAARESARIGRLLESVTVNFLTRFGGKIPNDVREDIVYARNSRLFMTIYMIAEVEEWVLNQTVISRQGDPLIVGYDGHRHWLIRAFDTTTTEAEILKRLSLSVSVN